MIYTLAYDQDYIIISARSLGLEIYEILAGGDIVGIEPKI